MDGPTELNSNCEHKTKGFFRNWIKCIIGLTAFVPFLLMLFVHRMLGLSDAFLAAPSPGETFWPIYNLVMVLACYAGFAGFFIYLVLAAIQAIQQD